jgi:C-terminal processing protease CtpA/Prc
MEGTSDADNVAELAPLVARDRLRGPVGSLAALVVRGRRDGPTRVLSLTREEVHVDTVVGRRIGDVAYIRVGHPESWLAPRSRPRP